MRIDIKFVLITLVVFLLSITIYVLIKINVEKEDIQKVLEFTEEDIHTGERLSAIYCSSCHIYPEPDLLTSEQWSSMVLPVMGPKMGIFEHNGEEYPVEQDPHLRDDYYPSDPMLETDEWQKIINFYTQKAPDQLILAEDHPRIKVDSLFLFSRFPDYQIDAPPTATAARFDPGNQLIYTSDREGENFLIFDSNLNLITTLYLSGTISDIQILNNPEESGYRELLITYLGSLHPSDAPEGFIVKTGYNPISTGGGSVEVIIDSLSRPVESKLVDLNQNGYKDLLINEFGHRSGKLFWLENDDNTFNTEKNILINTPGCIQSHIMDYNRNGLSDIVALCTQEDQAIYLFQNLGQGEFAKKTLLQFHILAGSSSFELHDFNGNGHTDILYTSGDNADFSRIFKPYHGVYIYLNDGNDKYEKAWFYPVNGAYDAKARDFNNNGYLDIAVISFFGDYFNRPEEGFLLFQNNGNGELSFSPYHHPSASSGRWIAMDTADWTGNGSDDILLVNYSLGPDIDEQNADDIDLRFTNGPLFLLLENRSLP